MSTSGGAAATATLRGRQIGAANAGLAYRGVAFGSLTPSARTSLSTPDEVVEGLLFSGRVDIDADGVIVRDCAMITGGINSFGFVVSGANVTIEGCLIEAPAGQSTYGPVFIVDASDGCIVRRCEVTRASNALTTYGTHVSIVENYLHDLTNVSDPTDHPDVIEVYGGADVLVQSNRLIMGALQVDAVVNIAPWNASNPSVAGCLIADNYIDGGQSHILIDQQAAGGDCTNVQVIRNDMGGHTNPDTVTSFGIYAALNNSDGRPIVRTPAGQAANPPSVYWPLSGPDVNRWVDCSDLTPDRSGQTVTLL